MAKILLVEDDAELASRIKRWLSFEHHIVELIDNGKDALMQLKVASYDLIILDWELPSLSGPEICRQARQFGLTTMILLLTGRSSKSDTIHGLDAGADDYLTKPFEIEELSAKLRALLRRTPTTAADEALSAGNLELFASSRTVEINGQKVELAPSEFDLLYFFMRNPNAVFSPEALLARAWGDKAETTVSAVRTCIKTLRAKLASGQSSVEIRTVHAVGYRFVPPR